MDVNTVLRLLGKGKGGHSCLVTDGAANTGGRARYFWNTSKEKEEV